MTGTGVPIFYLNQRRIYEANLDAKRLLIVPRGEGDSFPSFSDFISFVVMILSISQAAGVFAYSIGLYKVSIVAYFL